MIRSREIGPDTPRIQVRDTALNWFYRNGKDETDVCGLSIGVILSSALWQGFSSIYGYVRKYEQLSSSGSVIRLPVNASSLQRRVAREFGEVVPDLDPAWEPCLDEQKLEPKHLKVPLLAQAVRLGQAPFISAIRRRKRIHFVDWTTAIQGNRDHESLVLYRKSLFRSAIPAVSERHLTKAETLLPSNFAEMFNISHLRAFLSSKGYEWPERTSEIAVTYGQSLYGQIRKQLVLAIAQFTNMLDFYRPSEVTLPGDCFETWNILYMLCRQRGIQTRMHTDGYNVAPTWPVVRTLAGDWLPNRVYAYGTAHLRQILDSGFPKDRIDLIEPPVLSRLNHKRSSDRRAYDAVVLTWVPYTVNPSCDFESPSRTLEAAISTLVSEKYRRIAVKIKHPAEQSHVERLLRKLGLEADILRGPLHQHIHKSGCFIGGISTALAEVTAANRRYLVYEPYHNGYTDALIDASYAVSRESIARTEEELRELLNSRNRSWVGNPEENLFR